MPPADPPHGLRKPGVPRVDPRIHVLGSGIAPCRRNAAGANINDSIRITRIGDSTHVLSRNRSGSSTHAGGSCPCSDATCSTIAAISASHFVCVSGTRSANASRWSAALRAWNPRGRPCTIIRAMSPSGQPAPITAHLRGLSAGVGRGRGAAFLLAHAGLDGGPCQRL